MTATDYDKSPQIALDGHQCRRGWEQVCRGIAEALAAGGKPNPVVVVECYAGVHLDELADALRRHLGLSDGQLVPTLSAVFRSAAEIDRLCAPDLGGDDPLFGRLTRLTMRDFLDPARLARLADRAAAPNGPLVICGPGASLCAAGDLLVYADLPRREAQLRQRRDEAPNLGVENRTLSAPLQYKRSFFIDWRVCDKLKRELLGRWDFYLDTCRPGDPRMITGATFRAAMREAAARPFRFVPFFDPGPWGGRWMREKFDLPDGPPNYAWCFDCVPEENSLAFGIGGERVEMPGINLVHDQPEALLGEPVFGRMGAEFPIRTDFLDTMGGGNLSLQVHPDVDYAREHFGLSYTQDESYYILDAGEDAQVFLGLKDDVDPGRMIADLEEARKDPGRPFPDARHVARFPARRHDHFLIPAGTCHCSGANSMVLEISHTPYIFTFKLWDWGRLGLDGKPRPINLERGRRVIRWDRRESWVRRHLVNAIEPLAEGDGWREERTGLYRSEFLETRRHWFTGTVEHDTRGESVNVINLVAGREIVVESPDGAFAPFVVHYAETFVVPAAVGRYTIRPHGPAVGTECATLKVSCRV